MSLIFLVFLAGCAQLQLNGATAGLAKTAGAGDAIDPDPSPEDMMEAVSAPSDSVAALVGIGDADICQPSVEGLSPFPPIEMEAEEAVSDELTSDEQDEDMPPLIQASLDKALEYCRLSQDLWQKGELDNAIDSLDQAYMLVLNVDSENRPRIMQQIDDLRFLISKRILEIYASRNIVVNGNHQEIPLPMNAYVEKEIALLSRGDYFIQAYKRSGKYRAMIVEELKKAGLPQELSWLPLIESGYKTNALSHARALGLWQFIPSTGYKFGLKRDHYIDERLDPYKSTQAAIAYLKELHQIFGEWTTVLAAYNCGEGRVLKVIRSQNVNYLDNFWDLYQQLPKETARYVPRFLATLHMVKNPEKYGLTDLETCPPMEFETVPVAKRMHLRDIAKAIGLSQDEIHELNPELRRKIIPGDARYQLRVPADKKETLIAHLENIPAYSAPAPAIAHVVQHRVRHGETLSTIAERYGTTVDRVANANGISRRNIIAAGATLNIPTTKTIQQRVSRPGGSKGGRHVVQRGDSLWIIARKYGTTTRKIKEANNLRSSRLHIGQALRIPGASSVSGGNGRVYRVKSGDVPFEIARRYNISLERLLKMNQLSKSSKIYPGQQLYVE